jgi:hypothetical protein
MCSFRCVEIHRGISADGTLERKTPLVLFLERKNIF